LAINCPLNTHLQIYRAPSPSFGSSLIELNFMSINFTLERIAVSVHIYKAIGLSTCCFLRIIHPTNPRPINIVAQNDMYFHRFLSL
jgi:hypothetical protein